MISKTREQLMAHRMDIVLTPEARSLLGKEGFDPTLGARPLRRAIQRMVEDPLSEQILAGEWLPGDVVEIQVSDGAIGFAKGRVPANVAAAPAPRKPKASMPTRGTSSSSRGTAAGGAAGE